MLDDKTLRQKVFLRLLGHPLTVAPFIIGMTTMMATWAMNWRPSLGLFAGIAGALGSVGVYLSQVLLNGDRITQEASLELEREANLERQKALDQLDHQLTHADDDPRPETALRELRELLKAFEESDKAAGTLNETSVFEVNSMVRQLFDRCVESLHHSDRLWQTSQRLKTAGARQPILQQREKIIHEIEASIQHLSKTLVALQSGGHGSDRNAELGRLRRDLDQSLTIARTVEERVNALVNDVEISAVEPPKPTRNI